MATKREFTNFLNSTDLKTAMIAKGIYPPMNSDQDYYDGSGTDIHLTHGMFDDGSFKTLNINGSNISSDFIEPNDPAIVRRWTKREMDIFIALSLNNVSKSDYVASGQNFVYTIIRNGITYTGTAGTIPNAMAKCLVNVINAM